MGNIVLLPDWGDVSNWDQEQKRKGPMAEDNAALSFILVNEPAGADETYFWRKQLSEMLQQVADDAVKAYMAQLDDYFSLHWDDHYYALGQVLRETAEKETKLDYTNYV